MPPSDEASREETIRGLYTELALHPTSDFAWRKGIENARALGYDPAWLEHLHAGVWESSAAVGNPFGLGPIHPGETVVDLGCGAGADVCVAALLVGSRGRVIGVDVTPAMVEKARANAKLAGLTNVEICEADMAGLSCPDACTHVVISNGAINLSPRKACVLKEAFRVLKPGGRLYIADMVREAEAQQAQSTIEHSSGLWANCVAGTLTPLLPSNGHGSRLYGDHIHRNDRVSHFNGNSRSNLSREKTSRIFTLKRELYDHCKRAVPARVPGGRVGHRPGGISMYRVGPEYLKLRPGVLGLIQ